MFDYHKWLLSGCFSYDLKTGINHNMLINENSYTYLYMYCIIVKLIVSYNLNPFYYDVEYDEPLLLSDYSHT